MFQLFGKIWLQLNSNRKLLAEKMILYPSSYHIAPSVNLLSEHLSLSYFLK